MKHKEKGNELFQEGKYVESIREYDEAIKHDNNNPVFYLNKSSALSKLMDMGQALDYIEKVFSLFFFIKLKNNNILFLGYQIGSQVRQGLLEEGSDPSLLEEVLQG